MPPSAEEIARVRIARKENRAYDMDRAFPVTFSLLFFLSLSATAFDQWHKGNTTNLYSLGFFVCIAWPIALYFRARRQAYLKSRYDANAALLEKWKDDPTLYPPKRALLWKLDAFLSRKKAA